MSFHVKIFISSLGNEDLALLSLYSCMAITRQKQGAIAPSDGVCTFQFAHAPTTGFIHLSYLLDSSRHLNLPSLSDQGPGKWWKPSLPQRLLFLIEEGLRKSTKESAIRIIKLAFSSGTAIYLLYDLGWVTQHLCVHPFYLWNALLTVSLCLLNKTTYIKGTLLSRYWNISFLLTHHTLSVQLAVLHK